MSAVVLSCGRTGTNVALEILRGSKVLKSSANVEDKDLFKRAIEYPHNYLTKMDTTYIETNDLDRLLRKNPKMKIIWTIRDPRDVCMSKIYRGQPNTEGRGNWTSDDGTPEGAEASLRKMIRIYQHGISKWPDRIKLVKMEDMITDTEETTKLMCEFLSIDFEEDMVDFPSRMRNQHKKKRYGNKVDKGQVSMWKRCDEMYDGLFANMDMKGLFKKIDDITTYFEY